jgi:hypothetical protein
MARVTSFPAATATARFPQLVDALDDFAQTHRLSFYTRAVLADLVLRVDPCWQTLTTTITAYSECSALPRRAVRRHFDELERAGAIRWTPGTSNVDGLLEVLVYDSIVYGVRVE